MHQGLIDADLIRREVPDFRERISYVSGSHAKVVLFKQMLREMGVTHSGSRPTSSPIGMERIASGDLR